VAEELAAEHALPDRGSLLVDISIKLPKRTPGAGIDPVAERFLDPDEIDTRIWYLKRAGRRRDPIKIEQVPPLEEPNLWFTEFGEVDHGPWTAVYVSASAQRWRAHPAELPLAVLAPLSRPPLAPRVGPPVRRSRPFQPDPSTAGPPMWERAPLQFVRPEVPLPDPQFTPYWSLPHPGKSFWDVADRFEPPPHWWWYRPELVPRWLAAGYPLLLIAAGIALNTTDVVPGVIAAAVITCALVIAALRLISSGQTYWKPDSGAA
jgi:hypothetical protein